MALYQIYFYVPKEDANRVKEAMFKARAGRIGDYEYCSWECEGVGQFRPKEGANPHIGKVDRLEFVKEHSGSHIIVGIYGICYCLIV